MTWELAITNIITDAPVKGMMNCRASDIGEEKYCPLCRTWKSFSLFNKNKNKFGGRDHYCRECKKAEYRSRRALENLND